MTEVILVNTDSRLMLQNTILLSVKVLDDSILPTTSMNFLHAVASSMTENSVEVIPVRHSARIFHLKDITLRIEDRHTKRMLRSNNAEVVITLSVVLVVPHHLDTKNLMLFKLFVVDLRQKLAKTLNS